MTEDNKNNIQEFDDSLITETGVSFRDRVSSIDKSGKRIWIYPTKPSGRFHRARIIVGYSLLLFYFILPFIKFNNQNFFLLDIFNRKFIIFGTIWWPQDFYIFAIGILSFAVFIVLFTAIFGRIFCGWLCPQIITMELVFRKIEYFIEGDANKQISLNKSNLDFNKFLKKFSKHFIFLILSFIINSIFLSYFYGSDNILNILSNPANNSSDSIVIIIFTLAFYLNYSWFREQACTYVCPYGRLQSVLLDKNSIVVGYDYKRGEPRGKMKHGQIQSGFGSCIDCGNCVRVCPTGIDIRNGIQLECVGCTNCIDACDKIMDKISEPRGLIKYTSILNIEENKKFNFSPRIILYIIILSILLSVFFIFALSRSDVEATILRARGSTYVIKDNGNIVNIFTMKLMNKTFETKDLTLKTENIQSSISFAGTDKLILEPDGILESTFLVEIQQSELNQVKNKLIIGIYQGDKLIERVTTTFSGP